MMPQRASARYKIALLIIIVALMLVACSPSNLIANLPPLTQTANVQSATFLWNNSAPLPKFISRFERWQNNVDNRLCIQLHIFEIWEIGDNNHDTDSSIGNSLKLVVDSVKLSEKDLTFASFAIGITRRDDQGKVVGSHGGDMSVCFEVSRREDGIHEGNISFQSTSGKQYQYKWAFKKQSQDKKIVIELPDSLQ